MTGRVTVLVCGEPARGDDAAGLEAVDLLSPATSARATIRAVGQLDVQHLLDVDEGAACVVVDAVAGIGPGELWVRSLAALAEIGLQRGAGGSIPAPRSSHQVRIDEAVAMAALLRGSPPAGTFVGIGGVSWDVGAPLSPGVAAGLPAFARAIAAAIDEAAGEVGG